MTYRFVEADTPALRRLPFERMESEGIARAVIWNRVDPCLLDWLECVNPQYALCWLAHDRNNALAGAVWLNPVMGLCGCVHFCIFKARHILRDAVVTAWAFQQEPYAVLWCALSDGTLAGLEGNLTPIVDRHIRSGAFQTQPFFSDGTDLALDVCGGWADESPLVLEVNSPAPLTVLAISTAVDASPYSGKGGF